MANTVTITYTAKSFTQAAKMQQEFVQQIEALGYQFKEISACPESKNKVQATLIFVRKTKNS